MSNTRYNIQTATEVFKQYGLELLETEYKNLDVRMKYKCLTCHYVGDKPLYDVLRFKSGCKSCNLNKLYESKKYTIDFARDSFLKNGLILLDDVYINNQTPMKFECATCCNSGQNNLANILNQGQGCKKCKDEASASKKRFNIEYAKTVYLEKNLELLENVYINSNTKMKYRCLICNYIGQNSLGSMDDKSRGCRECHYRNMCGKNHWAWNPKKTELNEMIRVKRSKHWVIKHMTDDPLYNEWLLGYDTYEIHHTPQINDWSSYLIENNLTDNNEIIMYVRETANTRERLSIVPTKIHKSMHKNRSYKFNKEKFEKFLEENDIGVLDYANRSPIQ